MHIYDGYIAIKSFYDIQTIDFDENHTKSHSDFT